MSVAEHKAKVLTAAGLTEVSLSALPEVLEGLSAPGLEVTWVHCEPDKAVIQALDDMGLDEVGVRSLRDGPERPRVEEFADHLYISLFSADNSARGASRRLAAVPAPASLPPAAGAAPAAPAPAADSPARSDALTAGEDTLLPRLNELRLFLGPRWLISVGHLRHSEYDDLAERLHRQVFSRGRGASFIAYHLCEWLVETLQPALERLDDRIDSLEDEVVLATGESSIQMLFGLKRDLVDLRRRVAPLRDVMQRLGSHGVLYVEHEAEVYFRDVHDDIMRVIELLDTYRDILSSALDLHLSSVSNRLNRVMKQLTVVATVFMPLSFIVGLFGTNFGFMPFKSFAWFLVMFCLMGFSIVAILIYTWRRT
jgi:magnesium/cobalt transport protein CorA